MELDPVVISITSLLISFFAAIIAYKANQISLGELEKSLRDLISQARRNMEDKSLHIMTVLKGRNVSDLNSQEKTVFETATKAYKSAIEDWLNAYEEACAKYLDKKIDKNRFSKTYKTEIRNIVKTGKENREIHDLIYPEKKSHYKTIWKVYKEWKNDE